MDTSERIQAAIRENPNQLTLLLARQFGVPEIEVLRAFPDDRAVELDAQRWEELIRRLEAFGKVHVLVSNGATTLEASGQFGGYSTTGEFFNVQTKSLDMHIRWREIGAVFAVEKPGHLDGQKSLPVLLKAEGRFVFSVLHPCFNSTGCSMLVELEDRDGELRTTHAVQVKRYLSLGPEKGVGIPGQPAPHYYFHRPLSVLLTACFRAGFVLDGLEEPTFTGGKPAPQPNWTNFYDIPPVLVARLQLRTS